MQKMFIFILLITSSMIAMDEVGRLLYGQEWNKKYTAAQKAAAQTMYNALQQVFDVGDVQPLQSLLQQKADPNLRHDGCRPLSQMSRTLALINREQTVLPRKTQDAVAAAMAMLQKHGGKFD